MMAYAWATGRIDFGQRMPSGALPIAKGPARKLRGVIAATARLSYDGKVWLVPGVPEAPNENAAVDALIAYGKAVESRLEAR